jgi:hypothetical protein
MAIRAPITSIGARAARLLAAHAGWSVEAVFDRSFYLRSGDAFVCIGDASIGDGPLNALVATGVIPAFIAGTLVIPRATVEILAPWGPATNPIGANTRPQTHPLASPAEPAQPSRNDPRCPSESRGRVHWVGHDAGSTRGADRVQDATDATPALRAGPARGLPNGRALRPGRQDETAGAKSEHMWTRSGIAAQERLARGPNFALRFPSDFNMSMAGATFWHPPPWSTAGPNGFTPDRLRALTSSATDAAPPASFVHARTCDRSGEPLLRRARHGLQSLRLAIAASNPAALDDATLALLGLGHGLTPSGDDVLSGAVIMLHALGRTTAAAALAEAIRSHMRARTSSLSCAFLEAACDGEPNAAVHGAIEALTSGSAPHDVIKPLAALGHTSGFDILAGILIASEAPAS